jgi:biopolymer transport protein ExbB
MRQQLSKWTVIGGAFLVAGLGSATALAAEDAAAAGTRSMWEIILAGVEWPTYFIVAGSFAAIALIVEHFIVIRKAAIAPASQVKQTRELIESRDFRGCMQLLRESKTYFARTMTSALSHARHGFDAMHDAAIEKSGELSGGMFRKVEYLSILGNLGPLMGLLGTVLGMIHAFGAMGSTGGTGGASQLATGISQALVNTMLGLALAIIGLGFFGVCRNRVDQLTVEATVQVLDLLEYFRPSRKSKAAESDKD